jgi:hypothetical protein
MLHVTPASLRISNPNDLRNNTAGKLSKDFSLIQGIDLVPLPGLVLRNVFRFPDVFLGIKNITGAGNFSNREEKQNAL